MAIEKREQIWPTTFEHILYFNSDLMLTAAKAHYLTVVNFESYELIGICDADTVINISGIK